MLNDTLVVIDFETTGLYPDSGDRITEVAAVRVRGDQIVETFESLVNCGVCIPPFITKFTGITQKMVDSAPAPQRVVPDLLEFIGSDAVAAHNASFDSRFLESECRRINVPTLANPLICSIRLAKRVFPGLSSYSLPEIAKSLGLKYSGRAHRAASDAQLTASVMLKIATKIRSLRKNAKIDVAMLRRLMESRVDGALTTLY